MESKKQSILYILFQKTIGRCYRLSKRVILFSWCAFTYSTKTKKKIPKYDNNDKKVLVIAMTYLGLGGVERVMLNILKDLDRKKFSIHLITTFQSDNPWHDKFEEYTDHITHIPNIITKNWTRLFKVKLFEDYVIKNNADILFITNSDVAYKSIPKIKEAIPDIKIYDLLHTHGTKRDNDAYLRSSMPFDKYINKRIVIDKYLKDYYVNRYPVDSDNIYIIYNGICKTTKSAMEKEDNKKFESITNQKISYIGRLDSDKSPIRLVDIAIELKKRKIPVAITVFGDGTLKNSMSLKSKEYGLLNKYIYFCGVTNKPLYIAQQSSFTILTSDAEGIPMSVLESMSVGTPAIAPAVGGIPEMINDNIDGFLVNIDNKSEKEKIIAFTDSIIKALKLSKDDNNKMSIMAKQKVKDKFSRMGKTYEHLFETDEIIN